MTKTLVVDHVKDEDVTYGASESFGYRASVGSSIELIAAVVAGFN